MGARWLALVLAVGSVALASGADPAELIRAVGSVALASAADPAELTRLAQENAALRAELAAAQAELATLRATRAGPAEDWLARREAELRAREARHAEQEAASNARLAALRARLPDAEGGSVTAAQARERAGADAAAWARLVKQARGINNPALWQEVLAAENALHQSQFLLARADSAHTVYRTRSGDSLAGSSGLFYGDPAQWSRLYEANRHVLDDPEQLPPGITLVVP